MQLQLTPAQESRFWSRVVKGDGDGCWIFTGTPTRTYPLFHIDGYGYSAHRVAYAVWNGPIPDGLMVCHTCDTPRCVRPDHLWLGTAADNQADKWRKGRGSSGDRNGSRKHPERLAYGAQHWTHKKPECVVRGAVHYWHQHPDQHQGEHNGRAKLTAALVREIRARAAAGEDRGVIAAQYGLSRSTVNRAVRRETWPLVD